MIVQCSIIKKTSNWSMGSSRRKSELISSSYVTHELENLSCQLILTIERLMESKILFVLFIFVISNGIFVGKRQLWFPSETAISRFRLRYIYGLFLRLLKCKSFFLSRRLTDLYWLLREQIMGFEMMWRHRSGNKPQTGLIAFFKTSFFFSLSLFETLKWKLVLICQRCFTLSLKMFSQSFGNIVDLQNSLVFITLPPFLFRPAWP